MRKTLFLMLFMLFAMLGFSPMAHAQISCQASKPSVKVETKTTGTRYIRSKSAKDLSDLHGSSSAHVGGLGGGEIGFNTETRFEITSGGNKACVKLTAIDVTFFAKPEIHVASNFSRASCEYNAVVMHEQGHIRILRKLVREYSPKVRKALLRDSAKIDTAIGPIDESQIKAAQNRLQKAFIKKVEGYNDKIVKVLEKRQSAYDSPAEYARVAAKCRSWDQKFKED